MSGVTAILASVNNGSSGATPPPPPLDLTNANLVTDGNSYGVGYPSYTSFPSVLMTLTPFNTNGATMQNFSVSGQSTTDMLSDEATQILPTYSAGKANIALWQEAGNEIYFYGSASRAISKMTEWITNLKASHEEWKVIVSTLIHRNQSTGFGDDVTTYNSKIDAFNTSLIALIGTGLFEGCIRPDLETMFATYASGGYHTDEVHPNQTGYNKYAELYKNAILAL